MYAKLIIRDKGVFKAIPLFRNDKYADHVFPFFQYEDTNSRLFYIFLDISPRMHFVCTFWNKLVIRDSQNREWFIPLVYRDSIHVGPSDVGGKMQDGFVSAEDREKAIKYVFGDNPLCVRVGKDIFWAYDYVPFYYTCPGGIQ